MIVGKCSSGMKVGELVAGRKPHPAAKKVMIRAEKEKRINDFMLSICAAPSKIIWMTLFHIFQSQKRAQQGRQAFPGKVAPRHLIPHQ